MTFNKGQNTITRLVGEQKHGMHFYIKMNYNLIKGMLSQGRCIVLFSVVRLYRYEVLKQTTLICFHI